MSQENLELVRNAFEAFGEDLDAGVFGRQLPQFAHPDVEWFPAEATHAFHGYAEVVESWRIWAESMEHLDATLDELIDAGDSVVAVVRVTARGIVSGAVGLSE